jgi:uncharacterized protein YecT (DUF1311 family)
MKILVLTMAMIATMAAVPAVAAETCDRSDQTQMGMNLCAAADAEAADAKLNAIYKKLAAKAEGTEKTALRDAQRAWIAYRDKECDYETIGSEGGSIRPMEVSMCVTKITEARTKELGGFLSQQ